MIKRLDIIQAAIDEQTKARVEFFKTDSNSFKSFNLAVDAIKKALSTDKKILIFGNGGSAADSQHFAAEFVNRFKLNRKALPVLALTTDTSNITSIANDRSYSEVFSRQIEAFGNQDDIAFGISTSGNSDTIIKAFEIAKQQKMLCISLTGGNGGKIKDISDISLNVSSTNTTARIQEVHEIALHLICDIVEREIFTN
jgi:D-sedoheptulose 7-phosphate isomerase